MVYLTREEEKMLAGEEGEAKRLAMEILVKIADAYKAEKLIPVKSCHVVNTCYKDVWDAGLEIAEKFVELGGKYSVFTTTDPSSIDYDRWREWNVPEDFAEKQFRIKRAHEKLGAVCVWTCIPYQYGGNVPRFGEHVAWTESSCDVFLNSVLGARTNRVTAIEDMASAIVGRTPYYGYHLDENRVGEILIQVKNLQLKGDDYHVFGYFVGKTVADKVPVITGIPKDVTFDELRNFGTAAAASGAVCLYHIPGITPEAKTVKDAFKGEKPLDKVTFGPEELKRTKEEMSTISGGKVDLVVLGCPHYSLHEFIALAEKVKDKKVADGVECWVYTNKIVERLAREIGVAQIVEAAGIKISTETCCMISPVELYGFPEHFTLMTNSGKLSYYAPGMLTLMRPGKVEVICGNTDECLKAAFTGSI